MTGTQKPVKKWLAVLMAILFAPLAMLYLGQLAWAGVYFVLYFAANGIAFLFSRQQFAFMLLPWVVLVGCAVHAARIASRMPPETVRPSYSRWPVLSSVMAVFFLLLIGVRGFFYEPYKAPSNSMQPTLAPGDLIIVSKWGYGNYKVFNFRLARAPLSAPLQRGDVVVFDYPKDLSLTYVKRVIGMPGDTLLYLDKKLTINQQEVGKAKQGEFLVEDGMQFLQQFSENLFGREYRILNDDKANASSSHFVKHENCTTDAQGIRCKVPAGQYFVMGDNRDNSLDSRYWGFMPAENVIGKVVYVVH